MVTVALVGFGGAMPFVEGEPFFRVRQASPKSWERSSARLLASCRLLIIKEIALAGRAGRL